MRARYKTGWNGAVLLAYDHKCYDGSVQRKERVFFCPKIGGLVREDDVLSGGMKQVYAGLANSGIALRCGERETHLLALIRREYRAWRRAR